MTGTDQLPATREAWVAEQLAKAPDLTREQQRELRRVLLPAQPIRTPA